MALSEGRTCWPPSSSVTRLSGLLALTRGFASQPHDWFAFIGRVVTFLWQSPRQTRKYLISLVLLANLTLGIGQNMTTSARNRPITQSLRLELSRGPRHLTGRIATTIDCARDVT